MRDVKYHFGLWDISAGRGGTQPVSPFADVLRMQVASWLAPGLRAEISFADDHGEAVAGVVVARTRPYLTTQEAIRRTLVDQATLGGQIDVGRICNRLIALPARWSGRAHNFGLRSTH